MTDTIDWRFVPKAPPLVPQPDTTTLTLEVSQEFLDRLDRCAFELDCPRDVLAREWIAEQLRELARTRGMPLTLVAMKWRTRRISYVSWHEMSAEDWMWMRKDTVKLKETAPERGEQ